MMRASNILTGAWQSGISGVAAAGDRVTATAPAGSVLCRRAMAGAEWEVVASHPLTHVGPDAEYRVVSVTGATVEVSLQIT